MTERPKTLNIVLAFAAVYIIWGSTYLAIRFSIETIPPFFMAGVRFLVAGGLLYGWMRLRGHAPRPTFANWRAAFIVGGLLLFFGNGGVVYAEQTIPSSLAALMVATVPLWMVLMEWFRPRGRRPAWGVLLGVAMGLAGMVLLVGPWEGSATQFSMIGVLVIVVGTSAWAAGSIYSRVAPLPRIGLQATGMEMLAGGVLLTLASGATGEWSHLDLGKASALSIGALVYLIIFGSLIAFSAYVWLLKATSPAQASTYAYVNPVVAVFLGWALANEPVTGRTLIAAVIIIAAVAIITTARSRSTAPVSARVEAKESLARPLRQPKPAVNAQEVRR